MIAYLSGKILAKINSQIIIKTPSGIGYIVSISPQRQYMTNDNVEIFTLEIQRENKADLFGFESIEERSWMEKLLKVSGVGPKSAATIIYSLGINNIVEAINKNDAKPFAEVKGLGAKTAKKIVLELKGQLVDLDSKGNKFPQNDNFTFEFLETLSGLGYKRGEIVSSITRLKKAGLWNEENLVETVRSGLKALGRG